MSLGSRVFLLFGALLAILLGSQWFMMRSITQDVSRELGQVAFSVAKDTASFFILGKFQWNDRAILESMLSESLTQREVRIDTRIKTTPGHNVRESVNQQVFVYRPPAVEIRLDNQIEDDSLELITSAGTQSIPIPRDGMIKTVQMLENRMLSGTLVILVLGLLIAAYFSHRLSAPLKDLSLAAESVASGDLGTTIERRGRFISREIQSTVESFNHMSQQLVEVEKLKLRIRENEHYRELGEISRGLAHSVRNPLNTLGLSIEELSRDDVSQERRYSLVETAGRQINRVDQWVRSFMTFSLSADTQSNKIMLLPLIQDIQLEACQLEQRNVDFSVLLTDKSSEPLSIDGVEAEIRAILHALIINAVEASPVSGKIIISLFDSKDAVNIDITDQGDGIPEEIKANLFQPYQTTKARGSGMGLYMAYRLATGRYNGNIVIEDGTEGTVIHLTLAKSRVV